MIYQAGMYETNGPIYNQKLLLILQVHEALADGLSEAVTFKLKRHRYVGVRL